LQVVATRPSRREQLLDAAIGLVGVRGLTALTHRAVDTAAGVPTGTTSNYWRTRQALLDALVDRVVERERDRWEQLTRATFPSTASELAGTLAVLAKVAAGPDRALVLTRYALLIEAAQHENVRPRLAAGGERVNERMRTWMRLVGSCDPDHDMHVVANYWTGLVLHQLALPDPRFDPTDHLTALLTSLIPAAAAAR
jgi:DNA-binding transcriptional regulator YbjK